MTNKPRTEILPVLTSGNMHNEDALVTAIILQAVTDYRRARHKIRPNCYNPDAQRTVADVLRFFRSPEFGRLTTIDPEALIERLDAEIERQRHDD